MSRLGAELPNGEGVNGTNGTEVPEFKVPKTYKAAIYDAPGTISTKVVELETPVPGSGQVLINLTHSGVVSASIPEKIWPTLFNHLSFVPMRDSFTL